MDTREKVRILSLKIINSIASIPFPKTWPYNANESVSMAPIFNRNHLYKTNKFRGNSRTASRKQSCDLTERVSIGNGRTTNKLLQLCRKWQYLLCTKNCFMERERCAKQSLCLIIVWLFLRTWICARIACHNPHTKYRTFTNTHGMFSIDYKNRDQGCIFLSFCVKHLSVKWTGLSLQVDEWDTVWSEGASEAVVFVFSQGERDTQRDTEPAKIILEVGSCSI